MEHTPAPWTVNPLEGDDTPMVLIVDSNGNLICSTEGQGDDLTHTEANANLIAAAPELLEALEDSILNDLGQTQEDIKRRDGYRAIIAKAKGL